MVNSSIMAEKQILSRAVHMDNSKFEFSAAPKLNGIMAVAVTASKLRANSREAGRYPSFGTVRTIAEPAHSASH